MLQYDLSEVLRTTGMMQVYEIHEPPFTDDDVEYVSPLTGRVTVTNTGSLLLVRGPIQTTIAMECGRCLESVRVPIIAELEEEFDLKEVDVRGHHDKDIQVVEEEIGKAFEGKVLNLDVLIRQAALLAAPLQPLCREDCPGIPIKSAQSEADFANSPFRDLSKLINE